MRAWESTKTPILSPLTPKIDIYFGEERGKREIPTRHHNSHKERMPSKDNKPCPDPRRDKIPGIKPNFGAVRPPTPGAFCSLCPLGSAQGLKGIPGKVLGQDPAFLTLLCPHPGEERGDPGRGSAPWQLLPGDIGDIRSLPGDTDPIPNLIPLGNRASGGFNLDNSGSIQGKGGQGSSRAWDGFLRAFSPGVGWD